MTTLPTSTSSVARLRGALTALSQAGQTLPLLRSLDAATLRRLHHDFALLAHPHQEPRDCGDDGRPWSTWLVLGGRGAGKTRLGAEWVRAQALGIAPYAAASCARIALVAQTEYDGREVMVGGESGLLAISPRGERPQWIASRRRLEWRNGAIGQVFSAEDPESLRGPQFGAAWCDELAKWRYPEAAFDTLQFALRLGARPRLLVTTTPRPMALIRRLLADGGTLTTQAPTRANAAHLSPAFLASVTARYGGTRLGRQELDGELIEDRSDALWSRALVESCRVAAAPALSRIVVAIDPPASSKRGADACGIVAAGVADGGYFVLDDVSAHGLTPAAWAARAVALYRRLDADAIVAEVNMGGEMVKAVLREVDHAIPLREVRATRGKYLRAEPVAALYEQRRVRHVGAFAQLEDEMCDFGPGGLSSGASPDRLDALVWAITALMQHGERGPRLRGL